MSIVYATNSQTDFPGANTTGDSTSFRAAYVSRAMSMAGDGATIHYSAFTQIPPVAGDITWIHFQWRKQSNWDGAASDGNAVFELTSGSGIKIMDFDLLDGVLRCRLFGSSTLTVNVTGNFDGTSLMSVDVKIDLTSDISVEVFLNETSVYNESQAWSSSPGNPELIYWRIFGARGSQSTNIQYISEVIVADESTIGMGLSEMTPDATGNYSDWLGDHVETGDNDNGTGASSKIVADKLSSVLSSFIGPSSTALRAVVVNIRASTRGGVVNDLRNFLRIASTDYNGAALGVGEGIKGHTTVWNTNPDTTNDWDTADFAGTELGVESLA